MDRNIVLLYIRFLEREQTYSKCYWSGYEDATLKVYRKNKEVEVVPESSMFAWEKFIFPYIVNIER